MSNLAMWLAAAVLFTLVCLGLSEAEGQNLAGREGRDFYNTINQREVEILTYPQMHWDEAGQLHNPGMLNPYPQRSTIRIEEPYGTYLPQDYRVLDPHLLSPWPVR